MRPESNLASTFLFPVYIKYKREKSTLNDFMKMVSKIQNRSNSTELTTQFIQQICYKREKRKLVRQRDNLRLL